ncbi:MAG TPA: hypothetical protein VKZ53_01100 [Candidatus Angelobacter sp.]|nr:hypothetical protein [Candidatus Angelobacter sp.]
MADLERGDEDRGIIELLKRCAPLVPCLKERTGTDIDVVLEIVTQYREHEGGPGIYLSREAITMLSELGGAMDHDIVPDQMFEG